MSLYWIANSCLLVIQVVEAEGQYQKVHQDEFLIFEVIFWGHKNVEQAYEDRYNQVRHESLHKIRVASCRVVVHAWLGDCMKMRSLVLIEVWIQDIHTAIELNAEDPPKYRRLQLFLCLTGTEHIWEPARLVTLNCIILNTRSVLFRILILSNNTIELPL